MSFDIARTPTLQAVATLDQDLLVEDLQQRVDAAARQAGESPEVLAADQGAASGRGAPRALSQSPNGR